MPCPFCGRMGYVAKIYVLFDLESGYVRYVGTTIRPMHVRLKGHATDAKEMNPQLDAWMRTSAWGTRVLAEVPDQDRFEMECQLINALVSRGEPLLNRRWKGHKSGPHYQKPLDTLLT